MSRQNISGQKPSTRKKTADSLSQFSLSGKSLSPAERLLYLIFIVIIIIICGRLFWLQIVKHAEYSEAAISQRTSTIPTTGRRGTIYDRNGTVLAKSVDVKTIYANPREVENAKDTAEKLAEVLGGSVEDYVKSLVADKSFVYIQKRVDLDVAEKVKALELPGIYQLRDVKRVYPSGSVGGQIIGAINEDGEGISGLELQYDDVLRGSDGKLVVEHGRGNIPIIGGVQQDDKARAGTDIVISIDLDLQSQIEQIMTEQMAQANPEAGDIMITDPKTGEILAACSSPLADLTNRETLDADSLKLGLVSDAFEPGSTFKVIGVSAAIEQGTATPQKYYDLPTYIKVGDHEVSDAVKRGSVNYSLTDILVHSSNVGMVKVVRELGGETYYDYMKKFGIGEPVGTDFPGGQRGILREINQWDGSTLGTMAFGQAVSVTPLHMVKAVGVIANEGLMTTPHFLISKGGQYVDYPEPERVISSGSAHEVAEMMRRVVTDGTARRAEIDGINISAKTGTAQYANPETGGYVKGANNVSIVGFAPTEDPKYLVYVAYKKTQAGPNIASFKRVNEVCIKHFNLKPTEQE